MQARAFASQTDAPADRCASLRLPLSSSLPGRPARAVSRAGAERGARARAQVLMSALALRRTKDTVVDGRRVVELPEKTVHRVPVALSVADRAVYGRWEAHGAPRFARIALARLPRRSQEGQPGLNMHTLERLVLIL